MSDSLSRQSGLFVAYAAVVPVESQHEGEFSTAGLSSLAQRGWASDGLHGRRNGGRNRSRWASPPLIAYLNSGRHLERLPTSISANGRYIVFTSSAANL